jgi:cytochrome c biogenesis factor
MVPAGGNFALIRAFLLSLALAAMSLVGAKRSIDAWIALAAVQASSIGGEHVMQHGRPGWGPDDAALAEALRAGTSCAGPIYGLAF